MTRRLLPEVVIAASKGEVHTMSDGTVLRREAQMVYVSYPDGTSTFLCEGGAYTERKDHRR